MSKKPKRIVRYAVDKIPLHQRTTKAYSPKVRTKAWVKRRKTSRFQENRRATANANTATTTTTTTTIDSGANTNKSAYRAARRINERVRSELNNANKPHHDRASYTSDNEPADSYGQNPAKLNLHQPINRPYLVPSKNVSNPSTAAQRQSGGAKLPAILAQEVLSRCKKFDSSRTGKISITIFRSGSYQLQLSMTE